MFQVRVFPRRWPRSRLCGGTLALAWLLNLGCSGAIGLGDQEGSDSEDSGTGAAGGGRGGDGAGGGNVAASACKPTSRRLARLTNEQFDNTVRDLLGNTSKPARSFPADDASSGFEIAAPIADLTVNNLQRAAEAMAADAVADLPRLTGCDLKQVSEDACAASFIDRFGLRAFRRPLMAAEREGLLSLYEDVKSKLGHVGGVRAVLEAALQSPQFLYVVEAGEGETLDGYQMASRLSYFLWASMPDEPLFAAAQSGKLATAEGLSDEVERMLNSDRTRQGLGSFFRQWLRLDLLRGVEKDVSTFPAFNPALLEGMRRSLEAFVEHVVWEGDGRLHTLLTSPKMFANAPLAKVYGLGNLSGDDMTAVNADPAQRRGFLTHPALMSLLALPDHGDPIRRGAFVREDLFCQPLPAPPDNLNVAAPQPKQGLTTRQLFAEHSDNPACSGCHTLIDPLGFAFEAYDGMGVFRGEEGGKQVDTSGVISDTEDMDGAFANGAAFIDRVAASKQVQSCMVKHMLLYALQTPGNDCAVAHAGGAFDKADGDIKALLFAIAAAPHFLRAQSLASMESPQ